MKKTFYNFRIDIDTGRASRTVPKPIDTPYPVHANQSHLLHDSDRQQQRVCTYICNW